MKNGKLKQVKRYLTDTALNPNSKAVIVYAENYNWRAAMDIVKAGGHVAKSKAELFDIIAQIRKGN